MMNFYQSTVCIFLINLAFSCLAGANSNSGYGTGSGSSYTIQASIPKSANAPVISGATYYFSTIQGDDARTATQAQNSATPWKSIAQLNKYLPKMKPGDAALFHAGEVFPGGIINETSGITFATYGEGTKPIISGFVTVSNWTNLGGGIFQSYQPSLGAVLNSVSVNAKPYAIGRYPNAPNVEDPNGLFLTYQNGVTNPNTTKELSSSAPRLGKPQTIDQHPVTESIVFPPSWQHYSYFIRSTNKNQYN